MNERKKHVVLSNAMPFRIQMFNDYIRSKAKQLEDDATYPTIVNNKEPQITNRCRSCWWIGFWIDVWASACVCMWCDERDILSKESVDIIAFEILLVSIDFDVVFANHVLTALYMLSLTIVWSISRFAYSLIEFLSLSRSHSLDCPIDLFEYAFCIW